VRFAGRAVRVEDRQRLDVHQQRRLQRPIRVAAPLPLSTAGGRSVEARRVDRTDAAERKWRRRDRQYRPPECRRQAICPLTDRAWSRRPEQLLVEAERGLEP
jgi:hypothetical protein